MGPRPFEISSKKTLLASVLGLAFHQVRCSARFTPASEELSAKQSANAGGLIS